MRARLRRLWAELRRDHIGDHARARELYQRYIEGNPEAKRLLIVSYGETEPEALGQRIHYDGPAPSPEAVKPESCKSL